jgi:exosome complex component RRP42
MTILSPGEQEFLWQGCLDNCRNDGRTCQEFRHYSIISGAAAPEQDDPSSILSLVNGSARLFRHTNGASLDAGCLHVMCTVKADIVRPVQNRPTAGLVEIYVDALSASGGASGGSSSSKRQFSESVSTLLQKLYLPHAVDYRALCIVPFHYVWRLQIDLFFLDGNLITEGIGTIVDACTHVMRAALQNTILPSIAVEKELTTSATPVNEGPADAAASFQLIVDGDIRRGVGIPGVEDAPTVVSLAIMVPSSALAATVKATPTFLVDVTAAEASCADGCIHISCKPPTAAEKEGVVYAVVQQSSNRRTATSLPVTLLPLAIRTALAAAAEAPKYYQQQRVKENNAEELPLLQQQFFFGAPTR